jgi:SPP1 gp7 family putative phage head morphogenesis protein
MTSALFRKLGRKRPDRAAARALAPKEPRKERARYAKRLLAFWAMWEGKVRAELGLRHDSQRQDARLFEATFGTLFDDARLDRFIASVGESIADKSEAYMRNIVRIRVPTPGKNTMIDQFTDRNVRLIKGLGDEQIAQLTELLRRSTAAGARAEELAPEVGKILNAGESRIQLIARDQTLKFYAATNQATQKAAGIDSYVWVTSRDERVRAEHAALDGQTFRYDDPPDTGNGFNNPGEDIQCRCVATPIVPFLEDI